MEKEIRDLIFKRFREIGFTYAALDFWQATAPGA
jgi:hypothetical protein